MKNCTILRALMMVLLGTCIQYHGILAYPSGAPAGQCGTMTPDAYSHQAKPQTSSFPYTITITPANFTNGAEPPNLTIRIQGMSNADTIKGILLQARDAFAGNSATLGSFVTPLPTNIKYLACTSANGAVTHNRSLADVNTLTFKWSSNTANNVTFFVTVVKSKQVFWTRKISDTVDYYPTRPTSPNPSTAARAMTTMDATTTTISTTTMDQDATTMDSNDTLSTTTMNATIPTMSAIINATIPTMSATMSATNTTMSTTTAGTGSSPVVLSSLLVLLVSTLCTMFQ